MTDRKPSPGVSQGRLVLALVAPVLLLLVGGYAGARIAYEGTKPSLLPGLSYFGLVPVLLVAGLLAVIGLRLRGRGRTGPTGAGTQYLAAGLALVVGATGAIALAGPLGFTYEPPVVLHATGPASLTLTGASDFSPAADSRADCSSAKEAPSLVAIQVVNAGTLRSSRVLVQTETGPSEGGPAPQVSILLGGESGPSLAWTGTAVSVDRAADGRSGSLSFEGLAGSNPVDKEIPGSSVPLAGIGDWPATLSGSFTWQCGDWIPSR